ncbi:hypothetical protein A6770_14065 [Nostoc minutum NIES-26]|uniref:Uncharacterized protein n=1 Tax=Nostoc minutum NIES-26 TaxID=1844469 RepID=A0A367RPY6_9NOSO|nr:hypothetical protein A6770_14065 [Nostoc minutum NIES-26]
MNNNQRSILATKIIISLVGIVFAVLHTTKILNFDNQGLILLVIAFLPWLTGILSKAELPGGWKLEFIQQIQEEQVKQKYEIEQLKFLIEGFVTENELNILKRLNSSEPFLVKVDKTSVFFSNELDRLRRLGLISNPEGKGRATLLKDDGNRREVKEHFYITEKGKNYLKFRGFA